MLLAPGRRIELSALEAQSDEETVPQTLPARKPLAPRSDATPGLLVTALWTPVPLWLSLDGGVRSLPAPARVALYELAVNGGGDRCGDDPSEALDGLCAGAGASLGAMLARRVVAVEGGRLRLVAPDGAAPARAATEAPTHSGAEGEPAEDRASVKRLAALWSKGGVETHEARLSWIDSPAGVRFLAREGRDNAWALDRADRSHGVNSGRFGRRQYEERRAATLQQTANAATIAALGRELEDARHTIVRHTIAQRNNNNNNNNNMMCPVCLETYVDLAAASN